MKIYLAARYGRRAEIAKYGEKIESLGHTVTSRWLKGLHTLPDGVTLEKKVERMDPEVQQKIEEYAIEDVVDVLESDLVISFTETGPTPRGGRHVEFGIAYAVGKKLWVVPGRENIFHWLPKVESMTWPEALERLAAPDVELPARSD